MMKNIEKTILQITWWDIIFLIPMFLLFSYLPTYNTWCILLNVIIIIFFGMGLVLTTHILWNHFLNKRQ